MSFVIQTDGVNDVLKLASDIVLSGDFDVLFEYEYIVIGAGSGAKIISDGLTSSNRFNLNIVQSTNTIDARNYCTIEINDVETRVVPENTPVTIRAYRNSNHSDQGDKNLGTIGARYSNSSPMDCQLKKVTVVTAGGTDAILDPDASDHSNTGQQPVVVDTLGSNNATGIGFPTDGSAWVDLGGGGGLTLVVSSIASLEAFGTPNIRRAQEILAVESILSLEAFGTPSLTIISTIAIPSIESEEAFGLPTVELTSVFVVVDSILTEEEFGTPTIIVGETFVLPVSIASAEAFGTPNVTSIGIVTQYLTVATIFSEEEFGVPDVSLFDKHLLVVSIQSGEEFGKPKILGGVQVTNTLNIPEVTLNQISDANHAINIVGNDIGNARRSVYQSAVVRVIDHDDDDATAVDDPTRMALFESKAHGQPWNKYKGHGEHSIHSGSVIETDTNMNQIFPTFEYNEFE